MTTSDAGSPLERLVRLGGRILRLGADADTVTALHHAEYLTAAGPKRRVRRYRLVATPAGPQVRVVECLDDEDGIVDYEGEDYFAHILRAYLESGAAARGLVGRAPSELLAAADIVAFGVRWMDRHLGAPSSWPVERLQARLEQDLLEARRHGRHAQVAAIRGLKSALANAEAVPLPERPFELVKGRADVPRRRLSEVEVGGIIEREIAERRRAIDQYRALGVDTGSLEIELATLERYDRAAMSRPQRQPVTPRDRRRFERALVALPPGHGRLERGLRLVMRVAFRLLGWRLESRRPGRAAGRTRRADPVPGCVVVAGPASGVDRAVPAAVGVARERRAPGLAGRRPDGDALVVAPAIAATPRRHPHHWRHGRASLVRRAGGAGARGRCCRRHLPGSRSALRP